MTDFEKQVAAALEPPSAFGESASQYAAWIAPRVAAAIDALAKPYADDIGNERTSPAEIPDHFAALREDALAALRGEA